MKNRCANSIRSIIVAPVAAVAFAIALATPLMAQRGSTTPARAPINPASATGVGTRDEGVRALEMERERANKKELDPRAKMEQVNEDFGRLQDVNNDLLRETSSSNPLNYQRIVEGAEEIKMRAARLKSNLSLPQTGKDENRQKFKVEPDGAQLKSSISTLSGLVISFATNPIFKSTGNVDPKLGGKARRDLEGIIDLSDRMRKSAEKMKKSAGKSD